MKIKEALVIDNKIIDEMIAECMHPAIYEVLEHIKSHLKPLEPIVRDAYCMGRIDIRGLFANNYINKTEI